ncbi:hypothetical protein SRHO_G00041330 [Serrasalmus rhombeus]
MVQAAGLSAHRQVTGCSPGVTFFWQLTAGLPGVPRGKDGGVGEEKEIKFISDLQRGCLDPEIDIATLPSEVVQEQSLSPRLGVGESPPADSGVWGDDSLPLPSPLPTALPKRRSGSTEYLWSGCFNMPGKDFSAMPGLWE